MRNISIIAGFVVVVLMSCVNDYNPFDNKDNIDIKIEQAKSSIGLKDTSSIFSTESLTVYATVWEQIDSFIVASDSNRLWLSGSKKIIKPGPQDYRFYFSWNDTGDHPVDIRIFRNDGKSYSKRINMRVRSPLFQDSIVGEAGAVCTLYTPGIFDGGLTYHWYFGDFFGQRVEREYTKPGPRPVEIQIGQQRGKGSLWVEDTSGKRSPAVSFTYNFTDSKPPEIIVNSTLVKGDTVITGDSIFLLNYYIRDNGGIKTVSINDSVDYKRETTVNGELVTRVLTNMHTATISHPHSDTVIAIDAAGLKTTRIVYTVFDTNGPRTNAVVLQIVSPAVETWRTIDSSMQIIYKLYNYSLDTVFVRAARGTIHKEPDIVMPGSDTTLLWECPLNSGANTITINAYRKDTIASKYIVIERASDLVDTIHPQISHVLVNGQEGIRHSTLSEKIELSFLAFDNSNTLRSVTINGKNASPVPGKRFQYLDSLQTSHLGNTFIIRAVDNVGLYSEDTVYIRRNTPPEFTKESISGRFIIGESRTDTVDFVDIDGDSISVSIAIVPQIQAVVSSFTIRKSSRSQAILSWSGAGNPTVGQYVMRITLWDGYQSTTTERFFYVTMPGTVDIKAYKSTRTIAPATDTFPDGSIDLRNSTAPTRIGITIESNLMQLTRGDSVIVENAESVLYYNKLGNITVTLGNGRGRIYDTVNVLVRSATGRVDTADRIAVVYPPREPNLVSSLSYWFALDREVAGKDYDIKGTNLIDWWYNRVDGQKQLFSYSSGKEPKLSTIKTPRGNASLDFGPSATILINYPDGSLNMGGKWPNTGFTGFFVTKRNSIISNGGILWSSSDYDNVYFGIGISKTSTLAAFNRSAADSTGVDTAGVVMESKIVLDSSWNIVVFRSAGRSSQTMQCTIQMATKMPFTDSVTIAATGVSGNLMVGSSNKHLGRFSWPGQIAEIAFYQRMLTDKECQEVILYLSGKHGIVR